MGVNQFIVRSVLILALTLSNSIIPVASAQRTPLEGDMFPDLKLSLPQKMEEREYLKIDRGPFMLSEVDSEVLIVQIFSIYCHICQKEAQNVNSLFSAMTSNSEVNSRIKLVAIGAGNSPFEVNAFRELFKVRFPLIPDGDFSVHKKLGEVRTPYFFVLLKKPTGRLVVFSKAGTIENPDAFLESVCDRTGVARNKR